MPDQPHNKNTSRRLARILLKRVRISTYHSSHRHHDLFRAPKSLRGNILECLTLTRSEFRDPSVCAVSLPMRWSVKTSVLYLGRVRWQRMCYNHVDHCQDELRAGQVRISNLGAPALHAALGVLYCF